ncbi:tripartite tricarboxylate transporter TctB family protein (plasmid) [Aliirhizobium terrae]|uniref:tripartite tricarboxylate transporter TctB family protein n=1 Tax=Terrirhizobium terrae TaxID=2926709 RepID=UPI002576E437|nr:tripartite tricarboxylate transporter TctB family protein [Rhizobium sp. CC-CFT758]WJH38685.1 tripartite tricarboxylate transporter TctB family protein [Rhizobium sp. CC-CFT758]
MSGSSNMKRDVPDILAGAVMIGLGALGLWAGRDLRFGSAAMMGAGFLPDVICGMLIAIGGYVLIKAFAKAYEPIGDSNIKPLLILVAAIAGFAFMSETLGFVVSTIWLLVIGSLADQESRWREIAISTLLLTIFGALVFIYGLGVQMPVWPF